MSYIKRIVFLPINGGFMSLKQPIITVATAALCIGGLSR